MLEVGNGALTAAETRTHFAFWAAMKSPLLIGTNEKLFSPSMQSIGQRLTSRLQHIAYLTISCQCQPTQRTNIFLPSTRMLLRASPQRPISGALTKTGRSMQIILHNTGPVHHPMVSWFWCLTLVAPQPLVLQLGVRFRNWKARHTRWRIFGQELVWDAWKGELRGVWQPMILRGSW